MTGFVGNLIEITCLTNRLYKMNLYNMTAQEMNRECTSSEELINGI